MGSSLTALATFRLVATEFKDIPDDDVLDEQGNVTQYGVNSYLELYADIISKKKFGSLYNKALAFLTAHKMKMNGLGENTGIGSIGDALRVNSYSEGETSISFSTSQATNLQVDAEYALTPYGLEFLSLKRLVIIPIVSAGEAQCVN